MKNVSFSSLALIGLFVIATDRHCGPRRAFLVEAMTRSQCRAARGLMGMSITQLSGAAMVPRVVIEDLEAGLSTPSEDDLDQLRLVFESARVEFIHGERPSVRLRI